MELNDKHFRFMEVTAGRQKKHFEKGIFCLHFGSFGGHGKVRKLDVIKNYLKNKKYISWSIHLKSKVLNSSH